MDHTKVKMIQINTTYQRSSDIEAEINMFLENLKGTVTKITTTPDYIFIFYDEKETTKKVLEG